MCSLDALRASSVSRAFVAQRSRGRRPDVERAGAFDGSASRARAIARSRLAPPNACGVAGAVSYVSARGAAGVAGGSAAGEKANSSAPDVRRSISLRTATSFGTKCPLNPGVLKCAALDDDASGVDNTVDAPRSGSILALWSSLSLTAPRPDASRGDVV